MKSFLSLLGGACLLASTTHAQTTMPAIGAKTPKGEVAKTDASINPRKEAPNEDRSAPKTAHKRTTKIKMKGQAAGSM